MPQILPIMAPEFRPGRNRTGATIPRYLLMKADVAHTPDAIVATAADTDVPVGVTAAESLDGTNVDLCIRGRHPMTASGAIPEGSRIAPDVGGKVKVAAAGDTVCGQAVSAALADNDIFAAELQIPGSVL